MEVHLLAIQARVLASVGLIYIVAGLWLGTDPVAVAWRAAVAALLAMIVAGWLLRRCIAVVEERAASDIAERQEAAERAATQAGPPMSGALAAAQARLHPQPQQPRRQR